MVITHEPSFTESSWATVLSRHVPNTEGPTAEAVFVCSLLHDTYVSSVNAIFQFPRRRVSSTPRPGKQIHPPNKQGQRTPRVLELRHLLWLASNAEKEWLISWLSGHETARSPGVTTSLVTSWRSSIQILTWKRHTAALKMGFLVIYFFPPTEPVW